MEPFIQEIYDENKGRYGASRIADSLRCEGIVANRKRVARIMAKMGLCALGANKRPSFKRRAVNNDGRNVLGRKFDVDRRNAPMESLFKTLKRELPLDGPYETRLDARQEIFKYIELYYNTKRMHTSLGGLSPLGYERANDQ